MGVCDRYPSFFVCILIIFLLPEQKKNEAKRKFAVCIFLPTPALFSAKQKELASLKQLFVFYATKSTSASRQKNEAGPLSILGRDKLCFARFRIICLMYLRRNSREKTHTSNSEAHLISPKRFRHLVEGRKENRADFREEQKAV